MVHGILVFEDIFGNGPGSECSWIRPDLTWCWNGPWLIVILFWNGPDPILDPLGEILQLGGMRLLQLLPRL